MYTSVSVGGLNRSGPQHTPFLERRPERRPRLCCGHLGEKLLGKICVTPAPWKQEAHRFQRSLGDGGGPISDRKGGVKLSAGPGLDPGNVYFLPRAVTLICAPYPFFHGAALFHPTCLFQTRRLAGLQFCSTTFCWVFKLHFPGCNKKLNFYGTFGYLRAAPLLVATWFGPAWQAQGRLSRLRSQGLCRSARRQRQQQAAWSRAEHKGAKPKLLSLNNSYTGCYLSLTFFHSAVTSACVFT